MKYKFALALVSIVLIAGCTTEAGPTPVTGAAGLAITDFSLNPSEARGGQSVVAKMVIENHGQRDVAASDYFVYLIKPSDWGFTSESEIQAKDSGTPGSPMRRALGEQKPVPRTFTWSMKSPASTGADTPTDFTGRVYYNYETNASGTINIYPSSEVDRATEKTEFTSSKGPVEIAVEVNPNPPVIYAQNDEFTLTIHVKNKGNGVVYLTGAATKADPKIDEQAELGKVSLGSTLPSCASPLGSNLCISDPSCLDNIQFFGQSKEEITTCAIKVADIPSAKTPHRITITAKYGYYDEAKSRVILKAR